MKINRFYVLNVSYRIIDLFRLFLRTIVELFIVFISILEWAIIMVNRFNWAKAIEMVNFQDDSDTRFDPNVILILFAYILSFVFVIVPDERLLSVEWHYSKSAEKNKIKWSDMRNRRKHNEQKKLPEKEMDFEVMWMCEKDIMDIRRRYRTHASDIITLW